MIRIRAGNDRSIVAPDETLRWEGTPSMSRSSASSRVFTPTSWMPWASSGTLRAGRMQRVKPICAASRMRRAAWPVPRTSPASPTSPKTTVRAGRGRLRNEEATAAATPRSAAGSATSRPPATLTNTSSPRSCRPTRFSSTARSSVVRLASRPMVMRRGLPNDVGDTRAWISTSMGREPSTVATTAEPGDPARRSDRNSADGFGTGVRPAPVISNTPISEIAPKRFFTARTMRWCWCFSPRSRGRCRRCARGTWARPGCRPW